MAITAETARYIALDNKGWEIGALEFGEIRLDPYSIPEELAIEGDVRKMELYLVQSGYSLEAAAAGAREAKDFYGLGADCLWITFARGHLWWTFAYPQVLWMSDDVKFVDRVRKSIGGWRNTDVHGAPLEINGLSDGIMWLAQSRAAPDEATLRSLLDLINGVAASPQGNEPESVHEKEASSFEVPSTLFTVADIITTPSAAPDEAGLYAWWFDDLPSVPLAGALEKNGFRLAYVGIASHRPGSRRTLRQRLRNHCNGPIATSTLRRSLAAILIGELNLQSCRMPGQKTKLAAGDEARLTEWLAAHGRVAWIASATPWLLEDALLRDGPSLALNIRGNTHPFVRELLSLRQQLSDIPAIQ